MDKNHELLFSPIKIGKVEIKNRYVMEPIGPGAFATPTDRSTRGASSITSSGRAAAPA